MSNYYEAYWRDPHDIGSFPEKPAACYAENATPRTQGGEMKNPFVYQKPNAEQVGRIEAVRLGCKALHLILLNHCLTSRELSVALTNLEQVSMWANKSIVMEEDE